MPFHHLNIAIVGGGLGGLSLLNALLHTSYSPERVHLYEGASEFTQVGAGVKLTRNANRILDLWSLKEHMLCTSNVHPTNYMEYRHYRDAGYIGTVEEFGEPLSRMLHRADLLECLRLKLPQSCISKGKKLESISNSTEGYRLNFKDGSNAVADVIVGCDGIKSVVRKHLGLSDLPIYSGQMVYRGFVDYRAFSSDIVDTMKKMVNYRGPRRHLLTMPVGNDEHQNARLGIIAFMTEPMEGFDSESWLAKAPIDDLHEHVKDWNREVQQIVAGLRQGSDDGLMLKQALYVRQPLDKWFTTDLGGKGIVLLGDSAHSTLPHQGLACISSVASERLTIHRSGHSPSRRVSLSVSHCPYTLVGSRPGKCSPILPRLP